MPSSSFIYTKWFAYSGVAALVLSLILSWSILNPADSTGASAGAVVDLERDRANSEAETNPELWAVEVLAETLITEDMDPDLQPVNDVGSDFIGLIAEK